MAEIIKPRGTWQTEYITLFWMGVECSAKILVFSFGTSDLIKRHVPKVKMLLKLHAPFVNVKYMFSDKRE